MSTQSKGQEAVLMLRVVLRHKTNEFNLADKAVL